MANLYKREPKETVDGRLMNFLLKDPIMDGGQWDMVVNIIKKHGLYIFLNVFWCAPYGYLYFSFLSIIE